MCIQKCSGLRTFIYDCTERRLRLSDTSRNPSQANSSHSLLSWGERSHLVATCCCCSCCCCRVQLFATLWTIAHQAPLSMGFLGKRGKGWLFPFPGIFPTQGWKLRLLDWQVDSSPLSYRDHNKHDVGSSGLVLMPSSIITVREQQDPGNGAHVCSL